MEYCVVIKRNEDTLHQLIRSDLQDVLLSEKSKVQKSIFDMQPFVYVYANVFNK